MIKIIYFLNSTVRGGVEEHVLSILEKLDRSRFEPIFVGPKELITLIEKELNRFQVPSYAVSIFSWLNFGEISKFTKILQAEKP